MRPSSGIRLAVIGTVALLAACAPVQSELQLSPEAAITPSAVLSNPTTPASQDPRAALLAPRVAHTGRLGDSSSSADRQRGDTSGGRTQSILRLPVAADLGPNYFELLALVWDAGRGHGPAGQVSVAVVGFGFSERAKLRDERIERGGPLAAIARLTRHHSVESAARSAAVADAAAGQEILANSGAASQLGLIATLTRTPSSSHELALGLTATRTLQAGWFIALDGSRTHSVLETWSARRHQTTLTLVLVWGDQITDGWGRSLLQRLVQTPVGSAAIREP